MEVIGTKDDQSGALRPKELTEEYLLKKFSPSPSGGLHFSRIVVV